MRTITRLSARFFCALVLAGGAHALSAHAEAIVGQASPDFSLADAQGNQHELSAQKGKYVVLEWFNPDCPFVRKHYDSGNMQALQKTSTEKGAVWFSINSSASGKQGNYPSDALEQRLRAEGSAASAILKDEDGAVGRLYGAKSTPHVFVVNPDGVLIYAGAIDDKASVDPEDVKTAKNYVRQALDEAMAGKPVSEPSMKSYGCSVKYAD